MGNYNPNYFEKKPGSLEEAILNAVNGVKSQIDEKVTEYIELEFKDKQAAINAYKTINNKVYPGGMQPFEDINQEGNSIQLDKVDNAKKVLADFKKVGRLQFKVAVEEKLDPVGKEDGDIDNDGDKDASDKYLAKRRKTIAKAMKSEADDFKPHMMYDPKTGKGYEAKKMDDHLRMKKMGYTHEKPKMEAYEMGTKEYADHTKKITPGQTTEDWNKQVDIMKEKNNSMRSILADMWGVNEGKNPFDKEEGKQSNPDNYEPFKKKGKKEDKTMTGKPATKVSVDPDMNEKKK